jgi:probable rRNA maturation factor
MNDVQMRCTGVEPPSWLERVPIFCQRVLDYLGIDGWEISLLLCDSDTMKDLNLRYRGVCSATDVLSFEQGDGQPGAGHSGIPTPAGDIVIALDILKSQATEFRVTEAEELMRLLIHGILHLKGMRHQGSESRMIKIQEEIVKTLQKEKIF